MEFTTEEQNKNQTLQGGASTGSERPEGTTTAESGLKKTRVRYSGAARRRYQKQREKERAEKAQTSSPAVDALLTDRGGSAGAGTPKRVRPEHNTPSPSENRQSKKPKVQDQGSYAQAIKGLTRIALVLEGYPDKKLGADGVGEIRRLIRGRILALPDDAPAPTFTSTWEREGAMIFCCANQTSADWLQSLSAELKVEGVPLRVLPAGELPKRHRVVVHVEEPDLTAEETVKLLDRQNTGLAAREWVVVRGSESRDAKSAHFAALVSDSSLEALKTCGSKPFCGLGRATVKLLDKERSQGAATSTRGTDETV